MANQSKFMQKHKDTSEGKGGQRGPPFSSPAVSWRYVLKFCSPAEKRHLVFAFAALLINSVTNLAFPTIIAKAVDYAAKDSDGGAQQQSDGGQLNVRWIGMCLLSLYALGAAASWVRVYSFSMATNGIEARMRKRIFETVLHKRMEFFDSARTGELVTRLLSDVDVSAGCLSSNVASAVRSLNSSVGGTAMLLHLSPRLTMVSLAMVPFVGMGAMIYARTAKSKTRLFRASLEEAVGLAEEKLANVKTVRSFGMEEREVARFAEAVDKLAPLARGAAHAEGFFMGSFNITLNTTLLTVLFFGSRLVKSGALTMGGLTSFLLYSSMVGLGFSGLSKVRADLSKAGSSAERIAELIEEFPPEGQEESSTNTQAADDRGILLEREKVRGQIIFKDVSFAYPARPGVKALDGVNLEIRPGERLAVAGRSGAGKSTLVALLLRMYDCQEGSIQLDGVELSSLSTVWMRQKLVGVVGQEPALFSGTLEDNIRYGKEDASDEELQAAIRDSRCDEFIDRLPDKLRTQVGQRGAQLSAGQKQRVAIARAVLKRPPLLILDEATSALDVQSEREVKAAIDKVASGRTVLIIAHRPATIRSADRVIVMEAGKIVETGSFDSLSRESNSLLNSLIRDSETDSFRTPEEQRA